MSERKSLAELVAELEDPIPQELDPEAFDATEKDSEGEEVDDNAGRGHYETISKSKLRKQPQPSLGPQYQGSKIGRKDLDEDLGDDPFAPRDDTEFEDETHSDDEAYDDPDEVDLELQDEDDEEIASDDAFGEGEEEMFRKKGFTFKDSGKSASEIRKTLVEKSYHDAEGESQQETSQGESDASSFDAVFDELQVDESEQSHGESQDSTDAEDMSDSIEESDDGTESDAESTPDQDVLRAMISAEQKAVVSSLSGAIKSEAAKGKAVKKQYEVFDTLVGARVHLQKTLIAANTLATAPLLAEDPSALADAAKSAENAAINVLNSLNSLLHSVRGQALGQDNAKSVLGKRPFAATLSTSSSDISNTLSKTHHAIKPHRRAIMTKWASKTQASTLSVRNRLVQKPVEDSLVVALDNQLLGANQDRWIQKTRTARSCAPIQQTNNATNKTSIEKTDKENIEAELSEQSDAMPVYDDADFYALVLRELIDHKKSYNSSTSFGAADSNLASAVTPNNLLRGSKTKRANVDTKASKGRKMKYTVHEKLQNFMAPVDLGKWERRQAEELFAGLLGQKVARLDETEDIDMADAADDDLEIQGLRLFGGR